MVKTRVAYIAMRNEFFVVCTGEDRYQFEYAFNWDFEFIGVREEITVNDIDDNYWLILDISTEYKSPSRLFYKTPTKMVFIYEFPNGMDVYAEDTFKQPGSARDPEKRFVEWYDEKDRKKAAWFFPDGSMKKGKKKKPPTMRQLRKKEKELRDKGAFWV